MVKVNCCARASKLHAQRRKSSRQSLTVKPNLFAQRIAVARKTRANSLKHLFSLHNCRSRLEICTEVDEWETNVFTYNRNHTLSPQGAYRLEIISARSERVWSQIVYTSGQVYTIYGLVNFPSMTCSGDPQFLRGVDLYKGLASFIKLNWCE